MIYLASPYTHPDPKVEKQRYVEAARAASHLMAQGYHVFSPIAHTHPIKKYGDELPGDWTFWGDFDCWFIERCELFTVLMLDGWRESKGVQAEIVIALELNKPVKHMEPV